MDESAQRDRAPRRVLPNVTTRSTAAGADREPTPDEEQRADALELDPEVAEHEKEMMERGARQQGEGKLPVAVAARGRQSVEGQSVSSVGLETGDLEHLAHRRLRTDDADRPVSAVAQPLVRADEHAEARTSRRTTRSSNLIVMSVGATCDEVRELGTQAWARWRRRSRPAATSDRMRRRSVDGQLRAA